MDEMMIPYLGPGLRRVNQSTACHLRRETELVRMSRFVRSMRRWKGGVERSLGYVSGALLATDVLTVAITCPCDEVASREKSDVR